MNITGRVQVKHYGPDGELLAVREYRNLIVNEGLNFAARLLDAVIREGLAPDTVTAIDHLLLIDGPGEA